MKPSPLPALLTLLLFLSSSTAQLTTEEKQSLLDLHNQGRRNASPTASNMGLMVWDQTVAASAQGYASKCPSEHSGGSYGENMAWGWPTRSVASSMSGWYDEELVNYIYSSNTCTGACGHYTQIVWATSIKLGCGKMHCKSFSSWSSYGEGDVYVCQFDPPGNYIGESPYLNGTACSACPTGYKCSNGLCDSGLVSNFADSNSGPGGSSGGGLSTGQKVGIAIGVLLGVGLIAVIAFFVVKKKGSLLRPLKSTSSLSLPSFKKSTPASPAAPVKPVAAPAAPSKPQNAPPPIPKPSGAQKPLPQPASKVTPPPASKATPPPKPKGKVPLPPGWKEYLDAETNTPYYFNQNSGETSWVMPGNVN